MKLAEAVRALAPHCKPVYLESLELNEAAIAALGIDPEHPLRQAHWLCQGLHETDGGIILRESGNYSADRLLEIFGAGHSSAAVTPVEAARLAHNAEAIFNRVYGIESPHPRLAQMLGNTRPGDGWAFRGNMWFQTTGRAHHHIFGDRLGISLEAHPEAMAQPKYAVMPAALEWTDGGLNAAADRNDLLTATKKINGGTNGYASREEWLHKAWALLKDPGHAAEPWAHAAPDPALGLLQQRLNELGYTPRLNTDGRNGPATKAAVAWFQKIANVKVDGIAGDVTRAALNLRFATKRGA